VLSTFDLTLLGSLVSAGGLAFLGQAKWPHLVWKKISERQSANRESNSESRERLKRATTIAGARWLTVGTLTLFVAHTHGAEEGYLFGPWGDVLFHVIFVSTSWGTTAFRMKQTAERQTGQTNDSPISVLSVPETSPSRTSD
jgi:hypothetical protein